LQSEEVGWVEKWRIFGRARYTGKHFLHSKISVGDEVRMNW